jgi:hypothetical protein
VNKDLCDQRSLLETCNNAIFNLEAMIPEGKEILKASEDSLTSLTKIKSYVQTVDIIQEKSLKEESGTMTLYSELRSYSKKPFSRLSKHVEEQVVALKSDVRVLWDKVRELEMELGSWKASKRLLQNTINRLTKTQSAINADIKAGNDAFRPIWKVSSDVWTRIFRHTIQEEFAGYLKENPTNRGMRPPIFNLSQICRTWRYIVHNAPELWTLAYIAPNNVWRQDEHDLVTTCLEKGNESLTILTYLNQSFLSGYQNNRRYNRLGAVVPYVSPNENTLFSGKDYTLLVDMYDDHNNSMQRLSSFPLRQPTSLIFSSRSSLRNNTISSYISNFSMTRSFSIINDYPSSLPSVSFASSLPQLQKCTIHVKAFPNNPQLAGFLTGTLQELYLRNDAGGSVPNLGYIELPRLRILGITFPGTYLLDKLTARGLKSLTLYGPQDGGKPQIPLTPQASAIYGQLQSLKFEDWKTPNTLNGSLGAVATLHLLVTRTSLLRVVGFVGSYVDGNALKVSIASMLRGIGLTPQHKNLEEIILCYTNGVTNDHCESLKKLVKKVKVYL